MDCVILFGAGASIIRILIEIGAQNPVADGRSSISFCNLLFAGNACAAIVLFTVHRKSWTRETLRKLSALDWVFLLGLAIMANGIAPGLFFLGLESTMVTSVVLVAQIEPPLVLLLSWILFGERLGLWSMAGVALCLTGIVLTVALRPATDGVMIGEGEIYTALAAITYASSWVFGRWRLSHVPLGIFSVTRTAIGTAVFFIAASILYSPSHFMDLGSPFLWQWMVLYGGIIIDCGQLAWDYGIRNSRAIDVSLSISFAPVAGIGAAFHILGEQPVTAQIQGGLVLFVGIAICLTAARRKEVTQKEMPNEKLGQTCRAGFKGV